VQCPFPVGTVLDVGRSVFAVAGGRPRTKVNETEIETIRGRLNAAGIRISSLRSAGPASSNNIAVTGSSDSRAAST
jgi:hypothetical protein